VSGVHKNPTISFRISDYERREIEARIKASGMMKKTFFTRCCIYGRICVVGKKETVYMLVQTLEKMQADIHKMYDEIIETGRIKEKESPVDGEAYTDIEELQHDYLAMIKAVMDIAGWCKIPLAEIVAFLTAIGKATADNKSGLLLPKHQLKYNSSPLLRQ